ncbi:GntR family transcriptional regulator [Leucobacter coleopterorum]|uniref:GntR family transcriptional regulator n=1 Tax=Leucobacter coleopterorum TaxID=2714933 RepID=A0ABX6JY32_9MICO|nr:GntR family transcriptional regulator [Leucobacter coleopterorum]QIM17857.1 GntR family transcriptional regulator [Leucobacter coleopterorum]
MSPLRDPALEEIAEALHAAPGAETITRLSAIDAVRARILLAIEHRLYAPGEQLPPLEALAEGLDVAPITARRALETLVEDGVLIRRRGRGVAPSSPRFLRRFRTLPSTCFVQTRRQSGCSLTRGASWRVRLWRRPHCG